MNRLNETSTGVLCHRINLFLLNIDNLETTVSKGATVA